jgi:hypothetical protein
MREQALLKFPSEYIPSWQSIDQLSEAILEYAEPLENSTLWPILGLGKKAATTTKGVAVLASMGFWSDAAVLSRSLTDLETTVKWLLKDDSVNRIEKYLSGIEQEKKRLLRKMTAGISVSAQVLSDLIDPRSLKIDDSIAMNDKGWSGLTLRDMAREVDLERNYDLPYWILSAIAHSHVLSILDWSPDREEANEVLASFFCQHKGGFLRILVLGGVPLQALHIFGFIDKVLGLGLNEQIESAWVFARQAMVPGKVVITDSPEKKEFSESLEQGDVVLVGPDGSIVKKYWPKRYVEGRKKNRSKKR